MFCNITVTKLNMYIYPRASDLGVSGNSLLYLHCDIVTLNICQVVIVAFLTALSAFVTDKPQVPYIR